MKQGIVITTSRHTKDFLQECLDSLPRNWPILVVSNDYRDIQVELEEGIALVHNDWEAYELGGILQGARFFDEFVHLADTCVVQDTGMFDTMFDSKYSMYLTPRFFSHLGKYRTETLEKIGIPRVDNKAVAVEYERTWHAKYLHAEPEARMFDPVLPVHTDVFEERHGQKRMVISNGVITKYKGTWSL